MGRTDIRLVSTLASVLAGMALVVFAADVSAQDAAKPADAAAVTRCLREHKDAESCIGVVSDDCMRQPGGDSTMGMNECLSREIAVWDARLNAAYKAALAGFVASQTLDRYDAKAGTTTSIKGANLVRDTERAWIAYRDLKCAAAQLPMAGGTGASLLGGSCLLRETARQAIWLGSLNTP